MATIVAKKSGVVVTRDGPPSSSFPPLVIPPLVPSPYPPWGEEFPNVKEDAVNNWEAAERFISFGVQ